jgi:hypothetical protein
MSGATHGHTWRDDELIERHLRLNIFVLYRAGALVTGAVSQWQWPNGLRCSLRAAHGEIFLSGDRVQSIRFGPIPLKCAAGVRLRWFCPLCNGGAYHLHDLNELFACRKCCRYDWRCRHRGRYNPFMEKADGRSHRRRSR